MTLDDVYRRRPTKQHEVLGNCEDIANSKRSKRGLDSWKTMSKLVSNENTISRHGKNISVASYESFVTQNVSLKTGA
jgi:hypothetical protein